MFQKAITFILTSCLFCLFLTGFLHPITAYTQDLGRHLLLGKIIWQTHHIPTTNLLSYTYPSFPFLNHHYLSEVIYYLLKQAAGDAGLLLLSILLVASSCTIIYALALRSGAAIIPTAFLGIIYLRILFERTDIRPEQFGYLLFSLCLFVLWRFHQKQTKLILLLPLFCFLWIQLHITFIYEPFLIGLFLLDELITGWRTKHWQKSKLLFFVLFASIAATVINPHGLKATLYPLHVFDNYGYSIQENQTIFLLDQIAPTVSITYFKIAVLLLFVSLLLRIKQTKPIDWILAISFTVLGASAIRNFPFFALVTFIPMSYSFGALYNKLLSLLSSHTKPVMLAESSISQRAPRTHSTLGDSGEVVAPQEYLPLRGGATKNDDKVSLVLTFCLLLITFFQIRAVTANKPWGLGVEPGAESGVDFFVQHKLQGPIFNNFDIGSYLAYRLYPQEKVFIDGRPEAYPASFIQQTYIPMQQDPAHFKMVENKYKFNTIFFSHTDQTPWANTFLKQILTDPDWKVVYLDDTSLILVRNISKNQPIIKQFAMQPGKMRVSHVDETNFQSLLKLASFFNKTGLLTDEVPIDEKLIKLQPDYCPALYDLIAFYTQQKQSFQAGIYQQQLLSHCSPQIQ